MKRSEWIVKRILFLVFNFEQMSSIIKPLGLFWGRGVRLVLPNVPEFHLLIFGDACQIPAILSDIDWGDPFEVPNERSCRSQIKVLSWIPYGYMSVISTAEEIIRVVDWTDLINIQVKVDLLRLEQYSFLCQIIKHDSSFIWSNHYFWRIVLKSRLKNSIPLFALEQEGGTSRWLDFYEADLHSLKVGHLYCPL